MSRYVPTKTQPRASTHPSPQFEPHEFGEVASYKITDFQIPSKAKLNADFEKFSQFLGTSPTGEETLHDLIAPQSKPKVLRFIRIHYKYLKTINDFDIFMQPIRAGLFGISD